MRNLAIGSDAIDLDHRPSNATGTNVRVRDLAIVVKNAIGTVDRGRHDGENLGHARDRDNGRLAVVRVLVNRSSARSRARLCLSFSTTACLPRRSARDRGRQKATATRNPAEIARHGG